MQNAIAAAAAARLIPPMFLAGAARFGALPVLMDAGLGDERIAALRERMTELQETTEAIIARADEAGEDLGEDDLATIEQNRAEAEKIERQIAAREAAARPAAGRGRDSRPEPTEQRRTGQRTAATQTVAPAARRNDPRWGWESFGELALAVARVGRDREASPDARLQNAATTYGNEAAGAEGGFAVPPEFRREIWQSILAEENLLNRAAPLQTGGNSLTIPTDETAPWDTSNGIQVYWESEAGTISQTRPDLGAQTIRLTKVTGLVPLTDELIEDAPGMESWLRAKMPQKFASKINTGIIRGTGVGQLLGILNSGCLISVAKETSQPADTVYFANINKMWARMYAPCRRNAIWLINQDIEPQLDAMAFDPAATSKVPVYLPSGGVSGSPYASMKGRPVVPIEACSTLGDQGDIILADLTQYWALRKAGQDIRTDVSMHFYFDQSVTAFRFVIRLNGQPAWSQAVSPQFGTNTRSCFVTLDERA